jgi:hypothetical protein
VPRPPGSAIGRYQILGFVARGETSIIYRALEPDSGQAIILKILPPSAMRDPDQIDRFLRRASQLAGLDHPHLLPVVDYGREDGVPFVATPVARGGSLHDNLDAYRQPGQALFLVAGLAQAVDYLHRHDIVHGRIEPRHVLLDARGHPLLTGVGRAYPPAEPETGSATLAPASTPPAYLAPEQSRGQVPDARTDIYQLGALLDHLLLGDPPAPGGRPLEEYLAAGLDEDVAAILTRALAIVPEERFSTAAELAEQLSVVGQRRAITAPAPRLAPEAPAIAGQDDEPELTAAPEASPGAAPWLIKDRDPVWLVAALAGLVILLVVCCLSAMFAADAISGRLRQPWATAQVNTNVRAGPSVEYHIVGLLRTGEQATIHGVSPDGRWWQIAFAGAPGDRGWVPTAFVSVDRMGNVDVVEPPPPTSEAAGPGPPQAVAVHIFGAGESQ